MVEWFMQHSRSLIDSIFLTGVNYKRQKIRAPLRGALPARNQFVLLRQAEILQHITNREVHRFRIGQVAGCGSLCSIHTCDIGLLG
jgi:hypothetical protein